MSFPLMGWASRQTTGSPVRKAVLLALADCTNHETGQCNPSVRTLCAMTEFKQAAVRQALDDLVGLGFVRRTRGRRTNGTLSTYSYALAPGDGAGDAQLAPGDADPAPGDGASPAPGDGGQNLEVDLEPRSEPNPPHESPHTANERPGIFPEHWVRSYRERRSNRVVGNEDDVIDGEVVEIEDEA